VGVPIPGGLAITLKLTITVSPTIDGLGVWEVIKADVLALEPASMTSCSPALSIYGASPLEQVLADGVKVT
jgi:hypothetical protein